MSKVLYIAFPDQALEEVDRHFAEISGLPVVDDDYKCIGVLSKKDRSKASNVSTLHLFIHYLFFKFLVTVIPL